MSDQSDQATPLISLEDVSQDTRLQHITFSFNYGETLGIVGRSGAGKSTLLRLICGRTQPTSGTITFYGEHGQASTPREAGVTVSVIPQQPDSSLNPRVTVEHIISEACTIAGCLPERTERLEHIKKHMQYLGLPENLLTRRPSELSGGQRQRVAIARAFITSPNIVVADEAISALDKNSARLFNQMLIETNCAFVLATHDIGQLRQISDRVIVLDGGRCVDNCVPAELDNSQAPETVALLKADRFLHPSAYADTAAPKADNA